MADSARDPLRIPAGFWQRAEVCAAVEQRDMGRLFRLLRQFCGASQTRIGAAVGMSQGAVSPIMNGGQAVTALAVLERIADGLDMPDDVRMRLGLAPVEVDSMRRRTALGMGLLSALSPAALIGVLRESAAEATEFMRRRGTSAVGAGTLDHLSTVIADLDRSYGWSPAADQFPVARAYRRQVEELLNGRHTLAEARELHVHGAYLSHILADLAEDLGSTVAARAFATDSMQLASEAGHSELWAWAADSLAITTLWAGEPAESTGAALRGLRRVPRRHPLAARLHARAAQGYARRGDRQRCLESLARARAVCDRLPAEMPSRFTTDTAEHVSYSIDAFAADCHLELGGWKDAAGHARAALGVGRWSSGREAGARLDLAVALVHLGSPDEAVDHATRALPGSATRTTRRMRARRLDAALTRRYPNEPATKTFHEHYQQLVGA